MATDNPIRPVINTDEPCPIVAAFSFDHDDDSPRSLFWIADGQALVGLKFKIITAFDAGTIVIGTASDDDAYMLVLDLTTLPINTVVDVAGLLEEVSEDTEVILTLTGNPTAGKLDGFATLLDQFDRAK